MAATTTDVELADLVVIPVPPYDPYTLLPAVLASRTPRRTTLFGGLLLCFGAASVAFAITLGVLLALHF